MEGYTQFKVKVHGIDTSSNERTFTMVSDYHLTYGKVIDEIVSSQRFKFVGLGSYALHVAEGLQKHETRTS